MAGVPDALLEARRLRTPEITAEAAITEVSTAAPAESDGELELQAIAVLESEVASPEPVLGLF